jgi:hypothetical protein
MPLSGSVGERVYSVIETIVGGSCHQDAECIRERFDPSFFLGESGVFSKVPSTVVEKCRFRVSYYRNPPALIDWWVPSDDAWDEKGVSFARGSLFAGKRYAPLGEGLSDEDLPALDEVKSSARIVQVKAASVLASGLGGQGMQGSPGKMGNSGSRMRW